ncbi:hypothetical protein R1flu_000647 [Riccia fluitans]|uniref:CRAL-TRIO domain-containing protein n=1 Tax=Riccia fluitans TaxID=41844 RepID=A0ABD1Y124_9MARC
MGVTGIKSGDDFWNRGPGEAEGVKKIIEEEEGEEEEGGVEINAVVKWACSTVTYSDEFSFYTKGVVEDSKDRGSSNQQNRSIVAPGKKPSTNVQPVTAVTKPRSKIIFPHIMTRGSVVGNKVYCKTSINNCFTWRRRTGNGCNSLVGGMSSGCSPALLMNFYHERTSDTQSTSNNSIVVAADKNNENNSKNDAPSLLPHPDPEDNREKWGRNLPVPLVSPQLGVMLLGVAGAAGLQLLFPSLRLPLFEVLLLSNRKTPTRKRCSRGEEGGGVRRRWWRFPLDLALEISRPFCGSVLRRTMTAVLFLLQLRMRRRIESQRSTGSMTHQFMPNLITTSSPSEGGLNASANPSREFLDVSRIDSEVEEILRSREPERGTNLSDERGENSSTVLEEEGHEQPVEWGLSCSSDLSSVDGEDSQDVISEDGLSSASFSNGETFEQEVISDDGLSSCFSGQDIRVISEEEISAISNLFLHDLDNDSITTKNNKNDDDYGIDGLLMVSPTDTCSSIFTSTGSRLASDLSAASSSEGSRDSFSGIFSREEKSSDLSAEFEVGDEEKIDSSDSDDIIPLSWMEDVVEDRITDAGTPLQNCISLAAIPSRCAEYAHDDREIMGGVVTMNMEEEEPSSSSAILGSSDESHHHWSDRGTAFNTHEDYRQTHSNSDSPFSSDGAADRNSNSVVNLMEENALEAGANSSSFPSVATVPLEILSSNSFTELRDPETGTESLLMHSDSADEQNSHSILIINPENTRTFEELYSSAKQEISNTRTDDDNALTTEAEFSDPSGFGIPRSPLPLDNADTHQSLFPSFEEFQFHDDIPLSPRNSSANLHGDWNLELTSSEKTPENPIRNKLLDYCSSAGSIINHASPRADLTALMPEELAPAAADGAWEIKVDGFEVVWTPFKKDLSLVFASSEEIPSEEDLSEVEEEDMDSCKSADGSQTGEEDVDDVLLKTTDDDFQALGFLQKKDADSGLDMALVIKQSAVGLREGNGAEARSVPESLMKGNLKIIRAGSAPVNVRGRRDGGEAMSIAGLKGVILGDSDYSPEAPVENSLILRGFSLHRESPAIAEVVRHKQSSSQENPVVGLDSEFSKEFDRSDGVESAYADFEFDRSKAAAVVPVPSSEDSVFTAFSDGAAGAGSDSTSETDLSSEDSEASTSASSPTTHHFADHPTCRQLRKMRHSHGDQVYMEPAKLMAEPWRDLVYWHGRCREGRPTLVMHVGKAVRQLPASELQHFITVTISHAEYAELNFFRGPVKQLNILMDLDGLGLFRFPPMHVLQSIGAVLNRDYAGRGSWIILINAPLMLGMVINTIQRVILRPSHNEGAIDKGFLAGKNRILTLGGNYKTTLLNHFDESMIPLSLGGTCSGCSSHEKSCHINFDLPQ